MRGCQKGIIWTAPLQPQVTFLSSYLQELVHWKKQTCGVMWPSGSEHQTQTLMFLISRMWGGGGSPGLDNCVLKRDT